MFIPIIQMDDIISDGIKQKRMTEFEATKRKMSQYYIERNCLKNNEYKSSE